MLIQLLTVLLMIIIKIDGINIYKEEIIQGDKTYNSYKFNIYHHLSGISPYFESNNDQLNPTLPDQCQINKIGYLIRHGSVYVDDYDYYHIIKPFLKRLKKSLKLIKIKSKKFSFLSKWISPISNEKEQIEKLTSSGILEAYELGIQLSYRYSKLLSKQNASTFQIWASSSERTKQTANEILHGLFPKKKNIHSHHHHQIISISEEENRGRNSLLPTKSCQKFHSSTGSKQANIWLKSYTKPILKRFNSMIENFQFLSKDILAMQQLCGYETIIQGSSSFCHLFTSEEWLSYEYYFDIKYYYEIGYGNDLSPYLGIHWIKSLTDILTKSINSKQNFYISVVHREMLVVVLVSLGLYNQTEYIQGNNIKLIYPLNNINYDRLFKSSEIMSFLSRIQIEIFSCSSIDYNGSFVRILVNSLVKPLPGCSQGPGDSCPLIDFIHYINQRYEIYKNFSKICQNNYTSTFDHINIFENN